MEHFIKESLEELFQKGILTKDDRSSLMNPSVDDFKSVVDDWGSPELEVESLEDLGISQSAENEGSFLYPSAPLYIHLAHILKEWLWTRTSYVQNLKTYEHLEEGDGAGKRKMTLEIISCHLMTLQSSWEGLEDDLKKRKLTKLFTDIGRRGLLDLLGMRRTVGSQEIFPPPRETLEGSFRELNKAGSQLTVGARALAKHCHRDESNNWWGSLTGSEGEKNAHGEAVLRKILDNVGWLNIHQLPHALPILEVRNIEGYGARWSPDGKEFRGFLEPPMVAGWESGYRH